MWQYLIVPSKQEREKENISLALILDYFYELKKVNPDIQLLFADQSEEKTIKEWFFLWLNF